MTENLNKKGSSQLKTIILQASARSDGNTHKIVSLFSSQFPSKVIDLHLLTISPYNYAHKQEDDFLPLMRELVEYDLIIFATPVYWYSMSGLLKNFLDRITDCLKIEKETGRKLRGKNLAVISCGSEATEVEGFFIPFQLSAEYLGMKYQGNIHTWIDEADISKDVKLKMNDFANHLMKQVL